MNCIYKDITYKILRMVRNMFECQISVSCYYGVCSDDWDSMSDF